MTAAELVHDQTPYGEWPNRALLNEHNGSVTTSNHGRVIALFPDGSVLAAHAIFGCEPRMNITDPWPYK